jgi:hypothetical protein
MFKDVKASRAQAAGVMTHSSMQFRLLTTVKSDAFSALR